MSTLSGNQIQNLLWDESLDFTYITTEEEFRALSIPCSGRHIRLERLWVDEESERDWVLDVDDIIISLVDLDGYEFDTYTPSVESEEDLIKELVACYEEWS